MKIRNAIMPLLVLGMSVAVPSAATAQDQYPLVGAEYVEVTGVVVDDGHELEYATFLADTWAKGQAFALEQKWITGYEIMMNSFPRKGEPDIYLITRWTEWTDPAEDDKRSAAYRAFMAKNIKQMQSESGMRAEYRHVESSMLLQVLKLR